jgi:hypothetical protein
MQQPAPPSRRPAPAPEKRPAKRPAAAGARPSLRRPGLRAKIKGRMPAAGDGEGGGSGRRGPAAVVQRQPPVARPTPPGFGLGLGPCRGSSFCGPRAHSIAAGTGPFSHVTQRRGSGGPSAKGDASPPAVAPREDAPRRRIEPAAAPRPRAPAAGSSCQDAAPPPPRGARGRGDRRRAPAPLMVAEPGPGAEEARRRAPPPPPLCAPQHGAPARGVHPPRAPPAQRAVRRAPRRTPGAAHREPAPPLPARRCSLPPPQVCCCRAPPLSPRAAGEKCRAPSPQRAAPRPRVETPPRRRPRVGHQPASRRLSLLDASGGWRALMRCAQARPRSLRRRRPRAVLRRLRRTSSPATRPAAWPAARAPLPTAQPGVCVVPQGRHSRHFAPPPPCGVVLCRDPAAAGGGGGFLLPGDHGPGPDPPSTRAMRCSAAGGSSTVTQSSTQPHYGQGRCRLRATARARHCAAQCGGQAAARPGSGDARTPCSPGNSWWSCLRRCHTQLHRKADTVWPHSRDSTLIRQEVQVLRYRNLRQL